MNRIRLPLKKKYIDDSNIKTFHTVIEKSFESQKYYFRYIFFNI